MGRRRTKGSSPIAVAVLLVLLAGCTDAAGERALVVRQGPERAAVLQDPLTPASSPAGRASPMPDGSALVGMGAGRIGDLLGPPEMVMSAGRAQWWRFLSGSCAIEVFMMGAVDEMVVSHLAVRPLEGGTADDPCRELDGHLGRADPDEARLPAVQIH